MNSSVIKGVVWGAALALYLRFGLEATGWLFYEASHRLGIDWLYFGYSAFRGGGYAFGLWSYQTPVCIAIGVVAGLLIARRAKRKEA